MHGAKTPLPHTRPLKTHMTATSTLLCVMQRTKTWAIRLKVSFRSLPLAVCENYKCSASPIRNSCKQVYAVFKLWRSKHSSKSQQALRSYWATRNENRALTVTTTHVAHYWRHTARWTQMTGPCTCQIFTTPRSVFNAVFIAVFMLRCYSASKCSISVQLTTAAVDPKNQISSKWVR